MLSSGSVASTTSRTVVGCVASSVTNSGAQSPTLYCPPNPTSTFWMETSRSFANILSGGGSARSPADKNPKTMRGREMRRIIFRRSVVKSIVSEQFYSIPPRETTRQVALSWRSKGIARPMTGARRAQNGQVDAGSYARLREDVGFRLRLFRDVADAFELSTARATPSVFRQHRGLEIHAGDVGNR